jgi:hypothetical protein
MTAPFYHTFDPVTRRSTEIETDEGLLHITTTQAVAPIVESAKRISSNFDPHVKRDFTHVARIPLVVWARLMRTGVARDPKALDAWLNSRECRLFRTDDGRKL